MDRQTLRKHIGENIYQGRQRLGLSQTAFCKLIKISQPHLSKIENGVSGLEAEQLPKVLQVLDLTFTELVTPYVLRR